MGTRVGRAGTLNRLRVHHVCGGEAIDSGPISTLEGQRQTFSVEFPDPGTYEYICVYHAVAMVGVVTVK